MTIIFGGAAAVYKTILQRTIALSSTEAEFYALTEAGKLALYVRHILKDLGIVQTKQIPQLFMRIIAGVCK